MISLCLTQSANPLYSALFTNLLLTLYSASSTAPSSRIIVARANYIISHEIKNKKAQNLWVAFKVLCGNRTTLLYKKELTSNGLNCFFKVSLKTGSVFSQIGTVLRDEF